MLSWLLFDITINGDVSMLLLGTALFITANLAIGFTISTLAENQLQAMQASFFTLLPSILLSGFMFPFRGMPQWAQWLGEVMPTTHFIRIARSVMLKAATFEDIRASCRRCCDRRHRHGDRHQPLPHDARRQRKADALTSAR